MARMRFVGLAIFALALVAPPLYVLSTMVLPRLNSLEYSYAHEDQTVQAMFPEQ